jgi:hypothetical protein
MVITPHSIQEATIIYRNHSFHTSFYTRGYNHIQKSLLSHLILYKRLQSYTEITPLTPHSIQEATIIYRNHSSHTSFYTRGYNHIQKSLLSHLILYKRLQSYTEITPFTPHSIHIDANPFLVQSVTKSWDVSNLWFFSVIIIFHKILP